MDRTFRMWLDEEKISFPAYLKLIGEKAECNSSSSGGNNLKISVLISTYKRAAFLVRLLNSIKDQNYNNCEIIIIDDASNDDTGKIVSQYRTDNPGLNIIYLVNERNVGVSESKKRAYIKTSGDIIIFADDDDYYIEPSYFSILAQLYEEHPDCTMTIAATIMHDEQEGKYEYYGLNTPEEFTTREYLNGFMGRYKKPSSMFTMSLKSAVLKEIHYDELLCFNDTSLYLFALLGKGKVYTINQAVGIYYIHAGNMIGNTNPEYIIANLKSKEDIFQRAMEVGLLDHPKKWHYRNMVITAGHHFAGNHKRIREDKLVWKWMREHLDRIDYYRFVASVMKSRISGS